MGKTWSYPSNGPAEDELVGFGKCTGEACRHLMDALRFCIPKGTFVYTPLKNAATPVNGGRAEIVGTISAGDKLKNEPLVVQIRNTVYMIRLVSRTRLKPAYIGIGATLPDTAHAYLRMHQFHTGVPVSAWKVYYYKSSEGLLPWISNGQRDFALKTRVPLFKSSRSVLLESDYEGVLPLGKENAMRDHWKD